MMIRVLSTELLKLRRAKITWLTLLVGLIGPLFGGLFIWILKEPGRASEMGLIGQKAQFVGQTADWATHYMILTQMVGIISVVLFSVITAWVFGREYSEGTAKNMLALPVRKIWYVCSKLVVVFIWTMVLTFVLFLMGHVVGAALDIPGFSTTLLVTNTWTVFSTAMLGFLLMTPVAWLATIGKGYLAPLGFALITLLFGMALGATGWGKWFPWSIVPLYAGVAGSRTEMLAAGSLVVLFATSVIGFFATVWQFVYADNVQ